MKTVIVCTDSVGINMGAAIIQAAAPIKVGSGKQHLRFAL